MVSVSVEDDNHRSHLAQPTTTPASTTESSEGTINTEALSLAQPAQHDHFTSSDAIVSPAQYPPHYSASINQASSPQTMLSPWQQSPWQEQQSPERQHRLPQFPLTSTTSQVFVKHKDSPFTSVPTITSSTYSTTGNVLVQPSKLK